MTGPTGYAVAHLTSTSMGPEIAEYVSRIDATLEPFGGRSVIHGGPMDALEGDCPGDLVVIAFPDRQHARDWYHSPAYRAILPLRTANAAGWVALVDGVGVRHAAPDILDRVS